MLMANITCHQGRLNVISLCGTVVSDVPELLMEHILALNYVQLEIHSQLASWRRITHSITCINHRSMCHLTFSAVSDTGIFQHHQSIQIWHVEINAKWYLIMRLKPSILEVNFDCLSWTQVWLALVSSSVGNFSSQLWSVRVTLKHPCSTHGLAVIATQLFHIDDQAVHRGSVSTHSRHMPLHPSWIYIEWIIYHKWPFSCSLHFITDSLWNCSVHHGQPIGPS